MPNPRWHRIRAVLRELKRRRVFRAAGLYVIAAFAILEGASLLVPALHLPEDTMTLLVGLAAVGLPVALAVAWVFDIVPDPEGPGLRLQHTGELQGTERQGAAEGGMEPGAGTARAVPGTALQEPSVAVVPFLNLSGGAENEIFADGVTEDVIAHLSKIRSLKVISRTSVMPFRKRDLSLGEIGARLGVTTVLDGSVRRVGERVRIVAQLVDAATDRQLWAETYDRHLTDIFVIQTDVALHIAAALEAELSVDEKARIRKEPTRSLEAYQHYLKGRHWFIRFTPEALHRAIDYFRRAVETDPGYAAAWVGITMAYAELVESGALAADEGRPRATAAAAEALRLDPGLGEAHCVTAHLEALWDMDWEGAEAGFQKALALSPSSADAHDLYGRLCAALERFDEALALQRRAQELDPLAHRLDVATTLLRAGRHAQAEVEAARSVEFEPEQARGHATLGWALLGQGRTAEGMERLERAVALAPGDTQWLAQLGQARATTGDHEGAREILRELDAMAVDRYVAPYHLAFVHTGLGEHDLALDRLEQAFEERAGAVRGIKGSFLLAPLRGHPRFQALLARMNLA